MDKKLTASGGGGITWKPCTTTTTSTPIDPAGGAIPDTRYTRLLLCMLAIVCPLLANSGSAAGACVLNIDSMIS